jgi:hypothetical protein
MKMMKCWPRENEKQYEQLKKKPDSISDMCTGQKDIRTATKSKLNDIITQTT